MSELAIRRGAAPALAVERLSYSYPRAAAPALARRLAGGRAGGVRAARRTLGLGQVDAAARGLRAGPALPRRRGRGAGEVAGLDAIAAGPGSWPPRSATSPRTRRRRSSRPRSRRRSSCRWRCAATPPATGRGRSRRWALALAIPHLLGRAVDTLSGGELQRVALAAALVTRPRLVLLDEPTSQLDPVSGDELIWLLRRLNEEWGVAVRARRTPARALPGGGRPGGGDGGRADRLRRRPARVPRLDPASGPDADDPRRAPLLPGRDRAAAGRRARRAPRPRRARTVAAGEALVCARAAPSPLQPSA